MQTHEPREEFVDRLESVIDGKLDVARRDSTREEVLTSRRPAVSAGWRFSLAGIAAAIVAVVVWQAPAIRDAVAGRRGLGVVVSADGELYQSSRRVAHVRE